MTDSPVPVYADTRIDPKALVRVEEGLGGDEAPHTKPMTMAGEDILKAWASASFSFKHQCPSHQALSHSSLWTIPEVGIIHPNFIDKENRVHGG